MIYTDKGEKSYQTETVYNEQTGLPVRQLTKLDGLLQSPPDDTPAQVLFDDQGRIREMVWWDQGKEHRDVMKGPAKVKINPENGVHILECYRLENNLSRTRTEPALIQRDPESGEVIRCEFHLHGVKITHHLTELDPNP